MTIGEQLAFRGSLQLVDGFVDGPVYITSGQREFFFNVALALANTLCTDHSAEYGQGQALKTTYHYSAPRPYTTKGGKEHRLHVFRTERETSLGNPVLHETTGLGIYLEGAIANAEPDSWKPVATICAASLVVESVFDSSIADRRINHSVDAANLLLTMGLF